MIVNTETTKIAVHSFDLTKLVVQLTMFAPDSLCTAVLFAYYLTYHTEIECHKQCLGLVRNLM